MTNPRVKGIKYGTLAQFNAIQTKDPDFLYFITDKGLMYRGTSIVIPVNYTTYSITDDATSNDPNHSAADDQVAFHVETYGSNPAQPTVQEFTVCTKAAVQAIAATLNAAITAHAAIVASDVVQGHTCLSDAIDDDQSDAATGGTAATPLAVYNALAAAMQYVDTQMAGVAGAMLFKGTIGAADDYDEETNYRPGDYCEYGGQLFRCNESTNGEWDPMSWTVVIRTVAALPAPPNLAVGWTYRVVAPGTYSSQNFVCEVGDLIICINADQLNLGDRWTVAQNNVDGAVTAASDLSMDQLVVGSDGSKEVKTLPAGTNGQFLKIVNRKPAWSTHTNCDHGFYVGFCLNLSNSQTNLEVNIPIGDGNFVLNRNGIVVVEFLNAVPMSATLNVGGTGSKAIYHRNAPILGGVILAGDTATFVYNGTKWILIAVDHAEKTLLSQFRNDIIGYASCSTAGSTANKEATLLGFALNTGSIVAVRFAYAVPMSATLNVNGTGAKAIYHRNAPILGGVIMAGDTATFVYDGTYWILIAVDRPVDTVATSGSSNLVTSDAVYQAVQNATLFWEPIEVPIGPTTPSTDEGD